MAEAREHYNQLRIAMDMKRTADEVIEKERDWLRSHIPPGCRTDDGIGHKQIPRKNVSYKNVFDMICSTLLTNTRRIRAYEILRSCSHNSLVHSFVDVSTREGRIEFVRPEPQEETA